MKNSGHLLHASLPCEKLGTLWKPCSTLINVLLVNSQYIHVLRLNLYVIQ